MIATFSWRRFIQKCLYRLSLAIIIGGTLVAGALVAPTVFHLLPRPQAAVVMTAIFLQLNKFLLASLAVFWLAELLYWLPDYSIPPQPTAMSPAGALLPESSQPEQPNPWQAGFQRMCNHPLFCKAVHGSLAILLSGGILITALIVTPEIAFMNRHGVARSGGSAESKRFGALHHTAELLTKISLFSAAGLLVFSRRRVRL